LLSRVSLCRPRMFLFHRLTMSQRKSVQNRLATSPTGAAKDHYLSFHRIPVRAQIVVASQAATSTISPMPAASVVEADRGEASSRKTTRYVISTAGSVKARCPRCRTTAHPCVTEDD
jgi:hypothetical protein